MNENALENIKTSINGLEKADLNSLPQGSAGTILIHNGQDWTPQAGYGYENGSTVVTIDSKFIPEKVITIHDTSTSSTSYSSSWQNITSVTIPQNGIYAICGTAISGSTSRTITSVALTLNIPSATSYDHLLCVETGNGSKSCIRRSAHFNGFFSQGDIIYFWVKCSGSASGTTTLDYAYIGNIGSSEESE